VDIGFFAATNSVFSMPATLCIYFPGNETRIYDKNERLVSIDYRRYTTPYTDPLICYTREWKDIFHHDKSGRITGWDRIRARKGKERFTAYGDLAVTFDTLGRTVKARRIRYIKRYHGDVAENPGLPPSLAQVDDNIEVSYTYQSDDDFIGKPGVETKMFDAPEL
jgi:hypothetical protein